jgi:cytochrome c556
MMANHQKENMRDHLVVVQEVVTATARRDFSQAARAAERIGYSEAMGRMCEHMGAGAPGFTEQALAFHHSADRIVEAAKREDAAGVLAALGETLGTCNGCHATYKQQVVDKLPD